MLLSINLVIIYIVYLRHYILKEIHPLPKSIEIIISQPRDINRMVLSRVGNYRPLLQRQLRTKPKITSKILA